ncbi:Hypothetical protein CINCED_3A002423 [Cinara cedri]|uniref:Peptidase metallopeptidase domain-containing protein n=1 Tax=Cinara cedri TaxID=506608 RepID=A0A5E4NMH7_9HEMI|nr:Hypothetical protein CINCED_3A002423 [Cinara cedri]
MNYILILFAFIWLFTLTKINCKPLPTFREKKQTNNRKMSMNQENMIKFMLKFGYLDQNAGPQALIAGDTLVAALKSVQKFGGLEETGVFDNDTLKLINSKRCGVPDIPLKLNGNKNKRYVVSSNVWNKRSLTYYIFNFTPKLPHESIRNEIQKALSKWSRFSQLKFLEVNNENFADIVISFGVADHGDQFPFDGPGNTLAHAFYPGELGPLGGDIHFDDSEDWTLDNSTNNGVDFYSVVLHEMGHSLGLRHSTAPDSIMNPYYKGPQLQDIGYDDISGMRSVYIARSLPEDYVSFTPPIQLPPITPGKSHPHVHWSSFSHETCTDYDTVTPEPFTTFKPEIATPKKNDNTDECKGNFDAVSCFRGEIFVFKKNLLWRLNKPGSILQRYPVQLLKFFQVLANNDHNIVKIDAAYERPDSNIVMFSGKNYYVFNGNHLIENSPKSIMDYGFPPFLVRVDAVMVFGGPPLTYLFSGEYFWIYDDQKKILLQNHRLIKEHFKGIKTPIDAVLTWKSGKFI